MGTPQVDRLLAAEADQHSRQVAQPSEPVDQDKELRLVAVQVDRQQGGIVQEDIDQQLGGMQRVVQQGAVLQAVVLEEGVAAVFLQGEVAQVQPDSVRPRGSHLYANRYLIKHSYTYLGLPLRVVGFKVSAETRRVVCLSVLLDSYATACLPRPSPRGLPFCHDGLGSLETRPHILLLWLREKTQLFFHFICLTDVEELITVRNTSY